MTKPAPQPKPGAPQEDQDTRLACPKCGGRDLYHVRECKVRTMMPLIRDGWVNNKEPEEEHIDCDGAYIQCGGCGFTHFNFDEEDGVSKPEMYEVRIINLEAIEPG